MATRGLAALMVITSLLVICDPVAKASASTAEIDGHIREVESSPASGGRPMARESIPPEAEHEHFEISTGEEDTDPVTEIEIQPANIHPDIFHNAILTNTWADFHNGNVPNEGSEKSRDGISRGEKNGDVDLDREGEMGVDKTQTQADDPFVQAMSHLNAIPGKTAAATLPGMQTKKRHFVSTTGSLLKKFNIENDKRFFNPYTRFFIKDPYYSQTRRSYFDSIAGNLLKKSQPGKRNFGFDTIAGHLLKRDHPGMEQHQFDMIAGDLLKKSYPRSSGFNFDSIAGNLLKRSYAPKSGYSFDGIAGNLLKRSYAPKSGYSFDGIAGNLLKRSYAPNSGYSFDGIAGNLLKRSYAPNSGYSFDGIAGNLLKRSYAPSSGYSFDGIAGNLLKRSYAPNSGYSFDGIAGNLLRRSYPQQSNYNFDTIAGNLLKKSHTQTASFNFDTIAGNQADKRKFDMIAENLLKRPKFVTDKRHFDMIAGELIKRHDPHTDKRHFDSIAGSLLKRNHIETEKQHFESVTGNLLKESESEMDKRHFDTIAGSLLKKSDSNVDKGHFDTLAGSLLKKSSSQMDKRQFDTIAGSLLKKSDSQITKRQFDTIAGSLLKKSDSQNNKRQFDTIAGSLLKKSDSQIDKRQFDTIAGSLLKKSDSQMDKRQFDTIAGSLLKKSDSQIEKRQFDTIAGSLLKKSDSQMDKRQFDTIAGSLLKKSDSQTDKRQFDTIAGSLLKKSDSEIEKRQFDTIAGSLLKKSDSQAEKRKFDMIAGNLLKKYFPASENPYTTSDSSSDKRQFEMIAGNLLKKSNHQTYKRQFEMIGGNLLKKSNNQTDKRQFEMIASDLLKRHDLKTNKRHFDMIAGDLLKRSRRHTGHFDPLAANLLKRYYPKYPQTDSWLIDTTADHLLKKSQADAYSVAVIPETSGPVPNKRFINFHGRSFLIQPSDQDYKQKLHTNVRKLFQNIYQLHQRFVDAITNKRLLARANKLLSQKQSKSQNQKRREKNRRFMQPQRSEFTHHDHLNSKYVLEWIAGHLLKKRSPTTGSEPFADNQFRKNSTSASFTKAFKTEPKHEGIDMKTNEKETKKSDTQDFASAALNGMKSAPNPQAVTTVSRVDVSEPNSFQKLNANNGRNHHRAKRFIPLPAILGHLLPTLYKPPKFNTLGEREDVLKTGRNDEILVPSLTQNRDSFSEDKPFEDCMIEGVLIPGCDKKYRKYPLRDSQPVFVESMLAETEYPTQHTLCLWRRYGNCIRSLRFPRGFGINTAGDYKVIDPLSGVSEEDLRFINGPIDKIITSNLRKLRTGKFRLATEQGTKDTSTDTFANPHTDQMEEYDNMHHSFSDELLKSQPKYKMHRSLPSTINKRFLAPTLWQMLMEKNMYFYGRNFLDSIAGDLLK